MRLSCKLVRGGMCLGAVVALGAAAMAGDTQNVLAVETGAVETVLALDGAAPFHATTDQVVNARLVEIPNSAGVAALWSEVRPDGRTAHFYAISLDGQTFSRVFETSHRIELRYAQFDPLVETPVIPPRLRADAGNTVYLVQFVTQPLEAFQNALRESGATIHTFVAENAVVAAMRPAVRETVAQLPFVRWVGPLHPAYKLDEVILAAWEAGGTEAEPQDYSIQVFGRGLAWQQPIVDYVVSSGGTVTSTAPDGYRMTVRVSLAQVLEIARLTEVQFIDPWGPGEHDMDGVRELSGVPIVWGAGYSGQGVRGEIFDLDVQPDHPAWGGKKPLLHGPPCGGTSSHGTSTYGILFATRVAGSATGFLPDHEAGIVNCYLNSTQFGGPTPRLQQNTEATDPNGPFRSVFQTAAIGSPRTYNYTTISAETDDYLFRVDYLSCQSMSNAGLIPHTRPQAWAKNIVGVGGIRHNNTLTREDDYAAGSSGPASDNRIKPDCVHVYDGALTTAAGSGYAMVGGTSLSTAATAGCFGLAFQMWHEGVFPGHGGGPSVFDDRCKSSTAKALIINTAYRYDWTVGGPNSTIRRQNQGWGMPDVGNLFISASKMFVVDETDLLVPLGVNRYTFDVPAGEPEFAVTMVYVDPPGNPAQQSQHRINDLSLKVISPSAVEYWGNNGLWDGNYSTPGGGPNTKDTTENVFIKDPQAGTWTVEVHGDEIVQDSHLETPELDADYGLVVRGVVVFIPGDLNCDGKVNFDDIDPFVLALSGQAAYYAVWPNCNWLNADCNADGTVNFDDIDPFVALLGG